MTPIKTLNALKDITNAFDSFTTIEDSDLAEYYKSVFPHYCECGGEVIMTSSADTKSGGYTQLQCCNPYCWIKMACRFAYFMKSLGFKGFGETGAITLFRSTHQLLKYPTFLAIFDLPPGEVRAIMGDAYAADFNAAKETIYTSSFQFKDAITALGIPDIGKGSTIFDIVKSPVAFFDAVLKNNTDAMCDMAGIWAPKTRFYLKMSKIDIVILFKDVMPNVLDTPKREVYIAITGSVSVDGRPMTRPEFIWFCESLKDKSGRQAYKLVETKSTSKLDYVIADFPSSSSKYSLGKTLGILITADEFYQRLVTGLE